MPLISQPFLDLLAQADIAPHRVNAIIDRKLARGEDSRMRPGDYYPSVITRRTGARVVSIFRRSRHLLVTIESVRPFWTYAERSRNMCVLSVPGSIPATSQSVLTGQGSGRLALTCDILQATPIADFVDDDPPMDKRQATARLAIFLTSSSVQ